MTATPDVSLMTALHRRAERKPVTFQRWREDDPPPTTVGELGPDDLQKRVVIRTKDFVGTIYGVLVGVRPHPTLPYFVCVQLDGKKELTIRDDTEALVLDF